MDQAEVKERMRAMWAEGNWAAIAVLLDGAARALVEECRVGANHNVLEVAAGNGNVAVWAARAGARVVATDLSAVLVDQGRRRCAAEGLEVEWREADMEDLPFAEATFDTVLCAFGIGFAPRPELALAEMFRVARPGGCVGLANWTRDGWAARLGAVMERHVRPPAATEASGSDYRPGRLAAWLLEHAATVRMERGVVSESFASPEAWWEHWHASAPQMAMARRALTAEQYDGLRADLVAAARTADNGNGNGSGFRLGSEYLVVVANKRPAENAGKRLTLEWASPA